MKIILKEYSEKVIKQLYEKYKEVEKNISIDEVRSMANRFDQIKSNILKKATPVVGPDGKEIPPQIVIPERFLKPGKNGKPADVSDIFQWSYKELERLFDSYGSKAKVSDKSAYTVQEADLVKISGVNTVYSDSNINVYDASTQEACIKCNYAFKFKETNTNKIHTYEFCIGRKEDYANQYFKYRFGEGNEYRTFYFVVDKTQSADIVNINNRETFVNWYHLFIIHVDDKDRFGITDAVNMWKAPNDPIQHEKYPLSWNGIGAFMTRYGGESGKKAWEHIKNIKDKFVYVNPSQDEIDQALVKDKTLSLEQFLPLTRSQKKIYIIKQGSNQYAFTKDMFRSLDNELKNLALSSGYIPSYKDIIDSQILSKRYTQMRFKRNMENYDKGDFSNILPLPFVKFLSPSDQEKYYELFQDYLTYEYIEKFFGTEFIKKYINEEVKKFGYLPNSATKYMDNKQKQLFNLYSKFFKNWKYGDKTNVSDEQLEGLTSMPTQTVHPRMMYVKDWISLEDNELKDIKKLINAAKSNPDKLNHALYGMPFTINVNGKDIYLMPETYDEDSYTYGKWYVVDDNNNVLLSKISGENIEINDQSIEFVSSDPSEIFVDVDNVKIDDKPLLSLIKNKLNEDLNEWLLRRLQYRAGIIK